MAQKPELYVDYYFISNEDYSAILGFFSDDIAGDFIQISGYEELGWFIRKDKIDTDEERAMLEQFTLPIIYFNSSTEPAIPLPGE